MEHVNAYLEIEKARFADHMTVEIMLPEELMDARFPAFSLQPIVENAIKHGISQMIESGHIHISGRYRANTLELTVEDNAGTYQPPTGGDGLGMNLVDRRIKARYGNRYGITVESEADTFYSRGSACSADSTEKGAGRYRACGVGDFSAISRIRKHRAAFLPAGNIQCIT